MILHRRRDEFLLFTQHDHALLAGELARRIGNAHFASPTPLLPTIGGISLHDSGWIVEDAHPTLDPAGLPTNFLHSPTDVSLRAWGASVERAMAEHPWAGLLVSQHVLRLSSLPHPVPAGQTQLPPSRIFELNKFQHRQIEIQEQLRTQLGLRIDRALSLGLAPAGRSDEEDQLLQAAGWLRGMDSLSLDLLADASVIDAIDMIIPRVGQTPIRLALGRVGEFSISVAPWPFDDSAMALEVPFRRMPARQFANLAEFRELYANTASEKLSVTISPG